VTSSLGSPPGYYDQSWYPGMGSSQPDPDITTLVPATAVAGSGSAAVQVNGANFEATSVVEADGVALSTTYVSATRLTAAYDPVVEGTVQFTVRNASGKESNNSPFVVTAAEDAPAARRTRKARTE
jgi:hypothetical protein